MFSGTGQVHKEALPTVMVAIGGRGWLAEDCRMDSAERIVEVKSQDWKVVIRVKDMD